MAKVNSVTNRVPEGNGGGSLLSLLKKSVVSRCMMEVRSCRVAESNPQSAQ